MPDLSRLADAYRDKGVVVLTISSEEPEILRTYEDFDSAVRAAM